MTYTCRLYKLRVLVSTDNKYTRTRKLVLINFLTNKKKQLDAEIELNTR